MRTHPATFGEWRTSTYSNGEGACVEVAWADEPLVGIRDTKAPAHGILTVSQAGWHAFVSRVSGETV